MIAESEGQQWAPIPSRKQWELQAERATRGGAPERRNDTAGEALASPLLRTLGTQAGELAAQLTREFPEAHVIPLDGVESTPATLLERVQDDVRENLPPTRGLTLDGSVQIHSCHGSSRQVEVLREVLAGLLEEDRELEPRDVLILCPDVDAYAPLLHAARSRTNPCGSTSIDASRSAHPQY